MAPLSTIRVIMLRSFEKRVRCCRQIRR